MIVITVLNIIVVFMSYLARFEKHRYLLAWAFAILIMVLGIRYGYGNDFFSYKYMFDHGYPEAGDAEDIEPGWFLLNKLFKPFGFSTFVFFLTAIEHLMLYNLIRRHVPANYYWFAVFIYVFYSSYMLVGLSMMRQFLVQIIGLYVMEYAIRRKIIPFILLIIIAFTIHKVALLLLPLYLLPYLKTIRWWMLMIILLVLFFVLNRMEFLIDQLIMLIQGANMKYADSYLSDDILGGSHTWEKKVLLPFVIYFIFFVRNMKFLNKAEMSFSWMVVLGLFIVPFQHMFPMAFRAVWIYSFAEILMLPLLISKERIPLLRYSLLFLYMASIILQYISFFRSETFGQHYRYFKTILFT